VFFEMGGLEPAINHDQMSGNPVKIGDGCATVTGRKLPIAGQDLRQATEAIREGGSEVKPGVRIPV